MQLGKHATTRTHSEGDITEPQIRYMDSSHCISAAVKEIIIWACDGAYAATSYGDLKHSYESYYIWVSTSCSDGYLTFGSFMWVAVFTVSRTLLFPDFKKQNLPQGETTSAPPEPALLLERNAPSPGRELSGFERDYVTDESN